MMHFTIQKFEIECDTKMWMRYFIFALFHHERVHKYGTKAAVSQNMEVL